MAGTLLSASLIAALGGLLFGFDVSVISGTQGWLRTHFELDPWQLGFTNSAALIGTVIGSIFAGLPADRLGRRASLIWIALLYLVSAIGSAVAWDWHSFVAFRLIGGLGVGAGSVIAPLYIAEIAPPNLRGRLVGMNQLNIVVGILVAFVSNSIIKSLELGAVEARWMFGVEAVPALAFLLLMFTTPRSPRWLVARDREDEARDVLGRLGVEDVDYELGEIRRSLVDEAARLAEPLFVPRYYTPLMLAFALSMFNQLSGINVVIYYAPEILKAAGAGEQTSVIQTIGVGVSNLVFTLVGLAWIDRFGRKFLLTIGTIGYIVSLLSVSAAFALFGPDFGFGSSIFVLVCLMLFVASHAVGQGAVIWVFLGEIFPNAVRGKGQAFGSAVHWVFAALLTFLFPPLIQSLGGAAMFAIMAGCMIIALVWVLRVMPETRGVPLEQIESRLGFGKASEGQGG